MKFSRGALMGQQRTLLLCGSETYCTIIDDLIVAVYFYFWKTINSGKVQQRAQQHAIEI